MSVLRAKMRVQIEHQDETIAQLRAELAEVTRERDELAAHELAVAQSVGISYEADGVRSAPGPREVVLEAISDYRSSANELIDLHASTRSDKCTHDEGAVVCAECAQDIADERDRYREALESLLTREDWDYDDMARDIRRTLAGTKEGSE